MILYLSLKELLHLVINITSILYRLVFIPIVLLVKHI